MLDVVVQESDSREKKLCCESLEFRDLGMKICF